MKIFRTKWRTVLAVGWGALFVVGCTTPSHRVRTEETIKLDNWTTMFRFHGSMDRQLCNVSEGDLVWDTGEIFEISFGIVVNDQPTYLQQVERPDIAIGIGDSERAIGFGLQFIEDDVFWSVGTDVSAVNSGSFSVDMSERTCLPDTLGERQRLQYERDIAHFTVRIKRMAKKSYAIHVTWRTSPGGEVVDTLFQRINIDDSQGIENFEKLLIRFDGDGDFGLYDLKMRAVILPVVPVLIPDETL